MSSMKISNLTIEKMKALLAEGKRFDGRGLTDYRELEIDFDVSKKAEGCARVKLGKTEVIAGVKLQLGTPYSDAPDSGNLMVSADLLPLASPRYEIGPPKFPAIELPRIVDRAIRESGMIDLKKLVVKVGEKVWTVIVDLYPINDDGNIIDAAAMAAILALKRAKMPGIDKDGNIDYENRTNTPVPLSEEIAPISFTFYKLGNHMIVDPTREEEEASDTRITFGLSYLNGKPMINSSQKSGGGNVTFTEDEIEQIMEILPKKLEEFNKKLKKFL